MQTKKCRVGDKDNNADLLLTMSTVRQTDRQRDTYTYEGIVVEDLDDDWRRLGSDVLRLAVDLDSVVDERLVPGRTQCLVDLLCRLRVVEERDAREGI